jgi:NDP-sugar pyrophosphorylase family protein
MVAIIQAGGRGTRLRPFTISIPKPLLPLGEHPILEIVLRQLAYSGITRVVITVAHLAHLFTACIGDGSRFGLQIEYFVETEPLGTAGALPLVRDPGDTFLVMNGDVLTTLDYRALIAAHIDAAADATIALAEREVKIGFGVVESADDGSLQTYSEKPTIRYRVSMGINVLSRNSLRHIPAGKFDMPQLMEALRANGKKVNCHRSAEYWQDIGLFDDYERASADFAANPARFLPPTECPH